jgi:hypothetical protein
LVHLPNLSRQPEIVAALISQAQKIVADVATLESDVEKIVESARGTQNLANKLSDTVRVHMIKLAAIGDQLNLAVERELTARDQIEHYKGTVITDLITEHRKRPPAKKSTDTSK